MVARCMSGFIMKTLKYLWWNLYYWVNPLPKKAYVHDYVHDYVLKSNRCRSPWYKWKPVVFYNKGMDEHQVYLKDESMFTMWTTLNVKLYYSVDEEKLVGFAIPGEEAQEAINKFCDKYQEGN